MGNPIAVAVNGVMGRMGTHVLRLLFSDQDFNIIGGIEKKGHTSTGLDLGVITSGKKSGLSIVDDPANIAGKIDCIIDFSLPASTLSILEFAIRKGVRMVIGTTGFPQSDVERIKQAGNEIAIVMAPNMSVLVNLAYKLVETAAKALGDNYDTEIVESHHKNKVDAPSGTTMKMAEIIAQAYNKPLKDIARYERHGSIGPRPKGEIGIQTVRGGDIVGEHTVMFIGTGERLEIIHRATNRENFAMGALIAAKWVVGKQPGMYNMIDVLGLE